MGYSFKVTTDRFLKTYILIPATAVHPFIEMAGSNLDIRLWKWLDRDINHLWKRQ
jgi:hypothetical protein